MKLPGILHLVVVRVDCIMDGVFVIDVMFSVVSAIILVVLIDEKKDVILQ
jgi:hypothetical protein